MNKDETIEYIEKTGKNAQGKKEFIKILAGDFPTRKEALLAMCYECMGNYSDGVTDCQCYLCPLYPYMPYGSYIKPKSNRKGNMEALKLARSRRRN